MNTNRTSKAFRVRAAMTLLLLLLTSATAWADEVSYIKADGTTGTATPTKITNSTSLSGGWYIVDDDIDGPLTFTGDVNLILADDADVTIVGDNGIVVYGNLNIYGQSQGTGSLSIKATGYEGDGIWANGNISIIGGIITTTSYYHHGITSDSGDITITGGKVTATGENGIDASGNVTITGGKLTIDTSGDGIYVKNGGEIIINGGILTINANGYGITTYDNDITINGGTITVTATGENGIDASGNVTITGGKVTATGNGNGNGIYASDNIILGYTNDTDYIFASKYEVENGTIKISSGKTMIDGETLYSETVSPSSINNKILAPNLFNISDNNDGSSNSRPYIINSPEGLQLLATYVNSGTICEYNQITRVYDVYNGVYIKINCDIEFNPTIVNNFTPIGGKSNNKYYAFCGSFDGDGHTISGINIDINEYAGIFGYIGIGAEIKKVTLDNAIISGNQFTGGIVGKSEGGSISNCLVTNSSIDGSLYTGAIAGENTFEGILDHNYYSGCTVDGTPNVYNVGCGTDETPQDITALKIKGIEYLDGAVGYLSETAESDPTLTENQDVYFFRDFTAGVYSTIVLPFSYTPNDEGTFYTFTDIIKEKGSYVATMTEITSGSSLEANMPYLFKPKETKSLLFKGTALENGVITAGESESGNWKFKGTYKKLKYGTSPFTYPVYGFAAKAMGDVEAGEFVRADEDAYIPAMRCFLKYGLQSTRGETEELPEHITVKLVNDPTSIGTITTQTGKVTFDGWYSLDGRRFSSKPTRKGLYIYKGIKVTIK